MKIKTLTLLILLCLISCKSEAQITIESEPEQIEFTTWYKLNEVLEKQLNDKTKPWMSQQVFLDYSLKGNYKRAHEINSQQPSKSTIYTKQQIDSILAKYRVVDAKTYVVNQAKKHKVTILNESHHNPRHRAFTKSLLKELYNAGYTNLGLEALYNGPKGGTKLSNGAKILDEKDAFINSRKYPIKTSGEYVKEPQMGNLIREAIEIGFVVFSYEKTGVGSGYPREYGQAKNIQKVIEENPNSKILIHCGYSHGHEGVGLFEADGKAMAGWLKELTGIDPLTVDQTKYTQYSSAANPHPLVSALNTEKSSVLISTDGVAMGYRNNKVYSDVAVIHPTNTYTNNRPSWLFESGAKNAVLDLSFLRLDFPIMLLAFKQGEDITKAIPVDIIDVGENQKTVNLALKVGKYTLVAVNKEKEAVMVAITLR